MKVKLMVLSVFLVAALMAVPVTGKSIGPQKAEKNPHIEPLDGGVELLLPSGGVHEWMNDTTVSAMDFIHALDASKARIPNAMVLSISNLTDLMTGPEAALEAENKWGFVSQDVLVDLMVLEGFSEEEAEEMAAAWPEGIFVRFVNVGKHWDS